MFLLYYLIIITQIAIDCEKSGEVGQQNTKHHKDDRDDRIPNHVVGVEEVHADKRLIKSAQGNRKDGGSDKEKKFKLSCIQPIFHL